MEIIMLPFNRKSFIPDGVLCSVFSQPHLVGMKGLPAPVCTQTQNYQSATFDPNRNGEVPDDQSAKRLVKSLSPNHSPRRIAEGRSLNVS